MDIKMFFGSVFSVLKSKGVVEGGTGAIAKELNKAQSMINDIDSIDENEDSTIEI